MSGIEISYNLRPCTVCGKKALFHRWVEEAYPIGASIQSGGCPGGQIRNTFGLVEFEDGSLELASVENMRFVPGVSSDYGWDTK